MVSNRNAFVLIYNYSPSSVVPACPNPSHREVMSAVPRTRLRQNCDILNITFVQMWGMGLSTAMGSQVGEVSLSSPFTSGLKSCPTTAVNVCMTGSRQALCTSCQLLFVLKLVKLISATPMPVIFC